jgi:transposase
MLLEIAHNDRNLGRRSFDNGSDGWMAMASYLKERARQCHGAKIALAYEAGPHGAGLHDFLTGQGISCYMFAPTKMQRSSKMCKQKTDAGDAEALLETLRAHLLAGNKLPNVWVPDPQLRDDREIVRGLLDARVKLRKAHTQVQSLLKRWNVKKPASVGKSWTQTHRCWLRGLSGGTTPLGTGTQAQLASLLRQGEALESEARLLEEAMVRLAVLDRYRDSVQALDAEVGVGVLTAMVFLTELGDPARFPNRRKVAAYFGLVPSCHDTGVRTDCKGHITRQGSARVRWVICQAYHAEARTDPKEKERYGRLAERNPKRKRIAVVAGMRRKVIRLWHVALNVKGSAPNGTPPSRPPEGGKRHFTLPAIPRKHCRRSPEREERRLAV